ncbi:hypothetical protein TNCV_2963021 [Trichonephila clavipes]|nr:hypothetical protein TNCV_2963021 [Trichonephila clavipes]
MEQRQEKEPMDSEDVFVLPEVRVPSFPTHPHRKMRHLISTQVSQSSLYANRFPNTRALVSKLDDEGCKVHWNFDSFYETSFIQPQNAQQDSWCFVHKNADPHAANMVKQFLAKRWWHDCSKKWQCIPMNEGMEWNGM